jgi:hypothetical protein
MSNPFFQTQKSNSGPHNTCPMPQQRPEQAYGAPARGGSGGRAGGSVTVSRTGTGTGTRHWSGGNWGNNWYGGTRWNYYYYPYTYNYTYPYYYPYDYYYPYSYPYDYTTYYYVQTPITTTKTAFGSCACPTPGSSVSTDLCAIGYKPSCSGGSCTCVSISPTRALTGDWGCGNSSQTYCPRV